VAVLGKLGTREDEKKKEKITIPPTSVASPKTPQGISQYLLDPLKTPKCRQHLAVRRLIRETWTGICPLPAN
jgi:hypothetical protein